MKLVVKSCHVNAKRKPHEFGFGSVIMRKIPAAIANRLFCRLKTAAAIMLYSTLEKKSEVWSHFGMPKGIWQHTLQRSFFFFFVSICDYYRGELRSLGLYQVKWARTLSSWIDAAAAYNHTNMCVSMEEYQAHFTFSLSPCNYIATCISRSRRQSVEEQNSLELLCTLQNSPHTHIYKNVGCC